MSVRGFACLFLLLAFSVATPPAHAQTTGGCPAPEALEAAPQLVRAGDQAAIASFRETAPCHYWITFYFAAESLFKSGEKDEAVRWFYVGQLRSRTTAMLDPRSTPSLVQALQFVVGQPINEYAGGDRDKWLANIDWALEWDRQHPMTLNSVRRVGHQSYPGVTELDFDPSHPLHFEPLSPPITQAQLDAAYDQQRRGLTGLRESVERVSPEEWARQRRASGLQ
ncbi:MAG: hypothetical protein ABUS57_08380 [Pseudomonadota bacterium]